MHTEYPKDMWLHKKIKHCLVSVESKCLKSNLPLTTSSNVFKFHIRIMPVKRHEKEIKRE